MIKSKNGDANNFSGGSDGKESACMQETWVQSLDWEAPPEKEVSCFASGCLSTCCNFESS